MTQINLRQFGWALIPAVAVLLLWELGKYVARHQQKTTQVTDLPVATFG